MQEYKSCAAAAAATVVVVVLVITSGATHTFHFITALYTQVHLFNLAAGILFLLPVYCSVIDQVREEDLK